MTNIITVDKEGLGSDSLQKIVHMIRGGELIVYPTETVYGLGADATSDEAVLKVFEAKSRPTEKPISIAVDSLSMCYHFGKLKPQEEYLIRKFLPGPLTVLVEPRPVLSNLVSADTGKVGIRIPDQPVVREFIKILGNPITSTSANVSGGRAPTTVSEALEQLGDHVALAIDVGECVVGESSTVVDIGGGTVEVVREGPLSRKEVEDTLSRFSP